MHQYLRAIGFSNIRSKKETDQLIGKVLTNPTRKRMVKTGEKTTLIQIDKDFGENFGVTVIGERDEKGFLRIEHSFPYYNGNIISRENDMQIEKNTDKESYSVVCDDIRIGVSIIFYLQNISDYRKCEIDNEDFISEKVVFSALSTQGMILLAVDKTTTQIEDERQEEDIRNLLLEAAKDGDIDAMESLTLEDMDRCTIVAKRARSEDIYSIVDTCFMPYGIESDQYSIVGNILKVEPILNVQTKELVYHIVIDCNQVKFHVCINAFDVLGEPKVGRRFKGVIWLQGKIIF